MMSQVFLELPRATYAAVWRHLVPQRFLVEEAAFIFAQQRVERGALILSAVGWQPVAPAGFAMRSAYYLELSDETKASMIKRAHDIGASLVEFHSHTGSWPAQFSPSDLSGLREFVPHVWWRLKGRPYLAIVVTRSGFDGISWIHGPSNPQRLDGIRVGEQLLKPTGLSQVSFANEEDEETF